MHIQSVREADVPAIAQLACKLASHVADPDSGAETGALHRLGFGEDRLFECLVAEIDEEVTGCAAYGEGFETQADRKNGIRR
jgi:hypothetical protein